jgi:hypothetical protein
MRSIVFDTGPLISLAMNNLLWLVKPLKEKFGGEFYITEAVKRECVDRPLTSRKYKFEALQILKLLEDGIIKVYTDRQLKDETLDLLELSNSLFKAKRNYIRNVQYAEIETIVAAKQVSASAIVIDEFITRTLVEKPLAVKDRMEFKLHMKVDIDKGNIAKFKANVAGLKVIRSFEITVISYELGLFKDYYLKLPDSKKMLLDGVLWAIKLNGCSVSEQEINEAIKFERI